MSSAPDLALTDTRGMMRSAWYPFTSNMWSEVASGMLGGLLTEIALKLFEPYSRYTQELGAVSATALAYQHKLHSKSSSPEGHWRFADTRPL